MANELAKQGTQALSVPDFMAGDMAEGKQDISLASIRLPRLAIAQAMSPAMIPGDPAEIEGLKLFEMFNNLTGDIYGKGPLKFIPIQHRVVWIEFDPNDGNIILDRDVPLGDPRTQWVDNPNGGKGTPPRATQYTEVGALVVPDDDAPFPIIISIKMTNKHQVKAAERLTMFIVKTPGPIYGSIKTISVKPEKFDKGTAGVFVVNNLRIVGKVGGINSQNLEGEDLQKDIQLYDAAKALYNSIKGKVIDIEREVGDDTFDAEALERESQASEMHDEPEKM